MSPKSSRSPVKESDFVLIQEEITQPLDHFAENSDTFIQRTFLFVPKTIASNGIQLSSLFTEDRSSLATIPVFFVLGNEGPVDPKIFLQRIVNYGSKDVIFLTAEHRGYGSSISSNPDQSNPHYVMINQVMQDYHEVVSQYNSIFKGPWIAAIF